MDKKTFFAALRKRGSGIFGTSLSQRQVDGVNAILKECARVRADLYQTAYILATAYGETGGKMAPAYENMNYSSGRIPQVFSAERRQGIPVSKLAGNPELLANTVYGGAWGAKNLGNTQPGDGWRFRGAGMGQITGRHNFIKWSIKLGLPLVTKPELLMQTDISVRALVTPMLEGWATGLDLSTFVNERSQDYINARKVWNGLFEAEKYAGYAKAFEVALKAGGWNITPGPVRPVDRPAFKDHEDNDNAKGGIIAALFIALGAFFINKRGKK